MTGSIERRLARVEAACAPARKHYSVHGDAQEAALLASLSVAERAVAVIHRIEWIAPDGTIVQNWIGEPARAGRF